MLISDSKKLRKQKVNDIIGIFLLALSGFWFGESENILMYQENPRWLVMPMFTFKWYTERNYLRNRINNKFLNWLLKYPFSFLNDGFHSTKSLAIVLLVAGVSLMSFGIVLNVVIAYIIIGIMFNIGYHY